MMALLSASEEGGEVFALQLDAVFSPGLKRHEEELLDGEVVPPDTETLAEIDETIELGTPVEDEGVLDDLLEANLLEPCIFLGEEVKRSSGHGLATEMRSAATLVANAITLAWVSALSERLSQGSGSLLEAFFLAASEGRGRPSSPWKPSCRIDGGAIAEGKHWVAA